MIGDPRGPAEAERAAVTSYLLVVNPKSGRGSGLGRAEALRSALPRAADVDLLRTRARGHASDAVAERARDFQRVIAVGGDGTLNEVLAGLIRVGAHRDQRPALGFLGSGTANAASRAFGLSTSPASMARSLVSVEARPVDVGIVSLGGTERPFLLWLGAGYDAIVIDALNAERRGFMGVAGIGRRLPGVVRAVHRYSAPEIMVRTDSNREWKAGSVVLANVAAMAFGATATPAADPHDGHMDLLTVPRTGTAGVARLWMRMMLSSLDRASGVDRTPVTRARLRADGEVPVQIDGEPVGTLPADVRVVPGAVRLLMT